MKRRSPANRIVARFWDQLRADPVTGCYIWQRSLSDSGYGKMRDGPAYVMAHRHAWTLVRGPIPKGMNVLHRCDNPPCCNPAHLFLGTQLDNVSDMHSKGRFRRRPGPAYYKYPKEAITRAITATGVPYKELSAETGMSVVYITKLRAGKNRPDVR